MMCLAPAHCFTQRHLNLSKPCALWAALLNTGHAVHTGKRGGCRELQRRPTARRSARGRVRGALRLQAGRLQLRPGRRRGPGMPRPPQQRGRQRSARQHHRQHRADRDADNRRRGQAAAARRRRRAVDRVAGGRAGGARARVGRHRHVVALPADRVVGACARGACSRSGSACCLTTPPFRPGFGPRRRAVMIKTREIDGICATTKGKQTGWLGKHTEWQGRLTLRPVSVCWRCPRRTRVERHGLAARRAPIRARAAGADGQQRRGGAARRPRGRPARRAQVLDIAILRIAGEGEVVALRRARRRAVSPADMGVFGRGHPQSWNPSCGDPLWVQCARFRPVHTRRRAHTCSACSDHAQQLVCSQRSHAQE